METFRKSLTCANATGSWPAWPKTIELETCHSGQVVLGINLSRSKWDKQFYLELAQLLPQQLSTLISRFSFSTKSSLKPFIWDPCYLIPAPLTAAAVEVWRRRRNWRWNRRCWEVWSTYQEKKKEKVKPQVLLSGDRRPLICWPLNLDLRPQWDQGMDPE